MRTRSSRWSQRTVTAAAVLLAFAVVAAGQPNVDDRAGWPDQIWYVHGYDLFGGCPSAHPANDFASMRSFLKRRLANDPAWEWENPYPGSFRHVLYYECDRGSGVRVDHHGAHFDDPHGHIGGEDGFFAHREDGEGRLWHTRETPIQHLSYHLAWAIHDHAGPSTDIALVAHSMGGLIVRYMVGAIAIGEAHFPATLDVHRIVTAGTPHKGATGWGTLGCDAFPDWMPGAPGGSDTYQCNQMSYPSSFYSSAAMSHPYPQTSPRTSWVLFGSDEDEVVSANSAMGLDEASAYAYSHDAKLEHGDYYQEEWFDGKYDEGDDARERHCLWEKNGRHAGVFWIMRPYLYRGIYWVDGDCHFTDQYDVPIIIGE